jgi:hypothetical protein
VAFSLFMGSSFILLYFFLLLLSIFPSIIFFPSFLDFFYGVFLGTFYHPLDCLKGGNPFVFIFLLGHIGMLKN